MLDEVLLCEFRQVLLSVDIAAVVGIAPEYEPQSLRDVLHAQLVVPVPVEYSKHVFVLLFNARADVEDSQHFHKHFEAEAADVCFREMFLHELANARIEREST